jgi:phosphohistidine phosphatase
VRKLHVIRHAKSSWKDISLDDFDRPLNKRGKLNAPLMGARLKKQKIVPDIIISSPALRSKITAEVIAKEVKYSKNIHYNESLYESSVSEIYNALTKIDDKHGVAFLFGHNTGINIFVENFVNLSENVPTCGIVEIEFNCKKWTDISTKNAKLISFDYPKKETNGI